MKKILFAAALLIAVIGGVAVVSSSAHADGDNGAPACATQRC